jgi:hypothetical protein
MGRNSRNQRRRKAKRSKDPPEDLNFVLQAGPGCHIARKDLGASSSWILEWEDIDPSDFDEAIPDLAINTEDLTLSLCNIQQDYVIAYISVYETALHDEKRCILQPGSTTDNQGEAKSVTTLIVLCPPTTFAHLCYIDLYDEATGSVRSLEDLHIESDVQVWKRHPDPPDTHPFAISFPLQGGPFYCTQGEGGQLTHFFAGNLHAVDFRCPIGTPLLAVADGTVVEAKDDNRLTGISVNNLFQWNSIIIQVDIKTTDNNHPEEANDATGGSLFVEYVHIQSASVRAGDKVREGQVIGTSGSVGFSPEPHLHFAAYRSSEPTAATVRVHFQQSEKGETYLPKAGLWYNASGPVDSTSD